MRVQVEPTVQCIVYMRLPKRVAERWEINLVLGCVLLENEVFDMACKAMI